METLRQESPGFPTGQLVSGHRLQQGIGVAQRPLAAQAPRLQLELGQPGLAGAADFERQILLGWGADHLLAQTRGPLGISINAR